MNRVGKMSLKVTIDLWPQAKNIRLYIFIFSTFFYLSFFSS